MTAGRRHMLVTAGWLAMGLGWPPSAAMATAAAAGKADPAANRTPAIRMRGTPRGERVWFEPWGIVVPVGALVSFINDDPANSHTATGFHPALFQQPRRIPRQAIPWDTGFLLPGDRRDVRFDVPGVFDFYCLPHLAHGMVGRIVVGSPDSDGWVNEPYFNTTQMPSGPGRFPALQALFRADGGKVMPGEGP